MPAIDLAIGEVEDVAEDATDRSTHGVQDAKRLVDRGGHDLNRRSQAMTQQSTEVSIPIKGPHG
ncbi:hypothetical protein GCM10007857_16050 [Bradyrhizobium iriomotense]|uniref:Uncharacterized protein n=1 Tax=Bradyrhizobium iriomotense TaxID=441950 RepID=A0ABQ6AWA4_9BRAD|nr:hypothetical protein GCM10007857_16050 [Bradyrhizobium iriomotense]